MSSKQDHRHQLEQALIKRAEELESREMPRLKEDFRNYLASLQALLSVLRRKGLLEDDPYKYENKVTEIEIPPDGHFVESERDVQMTIRMTQLENILEYITQYFLFSIESLDLRAVKKLVTLTKYVKWTQLTETASSSTTRGLAELIGKLKKGSDTLGSGIIKDAQDQLIKLTKSIHGRLKAVSDYQKESYKLKLRDHLMDAISVPDRVDEGNREQVITQIKKRFSPAMPGEPYIQDLVDEILAEDYSAEAEHARREAMGRLTSTSDAPKKKKETVSYKAMLLEAIRILASASRSLDEAATKIEDDAQVLDTRKSGFLERLKQWIDQIMNRQGEETVFVVEYVDDATSAVRTERLQLSSFVEETRKKARIFAGIMSKSGAYWARLEQADEDQLFQFLNRNIEDVFLTKRRMQSLDTYFKSEVSREMRSQLRGLAIEEQTIKDTLLRANKKKHDYVARKEEYEQLKKLGIET